MTGYYRINRRSVWHEMVPWPASEVFLISKCRYEFLVKRMATVRPKQRTELPTNARICKDCAKKET